MRRGNKQQVTGEFKTEQSTEPYPKKRRAELGMLGSCLQKLFRYMNIRPSNFYLFGLQFRPSCSASKNIAALHPLLKWSQPALVL